MNDILNRSGVVDPARGVGGEHGPAFALLHMVMADQPSRRWPEHS